MSRLTADTSRYALMTILTQLVTLGAGIISRRLLGPTQMGIWSLLQILTVISSYSPMGVTEAVSRQIPFHLGRGESEEVEKTKNAIYSFSSLTSGLIALGSALYAFLFRESLSAEFFYGLLLMSVVIWLQRASNIRLAFLRGYKLFKPAADLMFLSSIVNAVLVAVLSYRFRMYGFIAAMILSFLFNLAYMRAHQRLRFHWVFDWPRIMALIRYGFPLILLSLIGMLAVSVDKLLIAGCLGVREVGLYSVAIQAYSFLAYIPNAVGIVLIPNLHQKYGESGKREDLIDYVDKATRAFTALMPALIAMGWFLIPFLTAWILPDFAQGVGAIQYLMLGSYFLALGQPYGYYLVAVGRQKELVPIYGLTCLAGAACAYLSIRAGYGISGVAMVATVVSLVRFLITYAAARRHYPKERSAFDDLWAVLGTFSAMLVSFAVIGWLMPLYPRQILSAAAAAGLALLLCAPRLLSLARRHGMTEQIMGMIQWRASGSPNTGGMK